MEPEDFEQRPEIYGVDYDNPQWIPDGKIICAFCGQDLAYHYDICEPETEAEDLCRLLGFIGYDYEDNGQGEVVTERGAKVLAKLRDYASAAAVTIPTLEDGEDDDG